MTLAHDDLGVGPPVVFVHGHPFDRTMWQPQLRSLSGRFRLVAPDLRGYGKSPTTAGAVSMAELANDVWALLAELGIDGVAVVGLSMGGLVAMELAIAHPQRVCALALIATTAQPVTEEERRQRLALAGEVEAAGVEPVLESMGPRLFGPHADERLVEQVTQMMRRTNAHGAAAALRGRAARPDYRDALRALQMPSFVCTGTHDAWSTPEVTRELLDCLREPRVLSLPDVGHLPNLENPERFDAELADFLDAAWVAHT